MKTFIALVLSLCLLSVALGVIITLLLMRPAAPQVVYYTAGEPIVLPTATTPPTSAPPTPSSLPPTAHPPITQTDLALPFESICGHNNTLTDLQQQDIAASQIGKRVVGWTGKVYDVESDGADYKVEVDMRDGIFESRQIEILGVNREIAAGLRVAQVITFDGIIQSVDTVMEDICQPIKIINAVIR
jgi:hypothetical protein